jgi:transcriptional regulator with XRE-family HTH domain
MTRRRKLSLMRGADLIREARLRAGLTQAELSERTGTQRSVIARWEQGAVSPSFDNMLEVIEACGFDLPLMLVPRDTSLNERLDKNRLLSPERRTQRFLGKLEKEVARG